MQPSGEVISRLLVLVQLTSLLQIAAKILIGVIYKLGHPCRWGRWLDDHDDDDDVEMLILIILITMLMNDRRTRDMTMKTTNENDRRRAIIEIEIERYRASMYLKIIVISSARSFAAAT